MTRYFLNSGNIQNAPDRGRQFWHDSATGLGTQQRCLCVFFAQPREDWEIKFHEKTAVIKQHFQNSDQQPVFELAFPDTFAEQVRQNDIIHISGGDDHLLQYWLKQFDIPKVWEGKVVATSSASTNMLSQHFWTCDWRTCMDGLGILPIKVIPHYKSDYGSDDPMRGPIDWGKAYEVLARYGDTSLPIQALKEGEYITFEV